MKFKYRAYKDLAKPDIEYGKMPLLQVTLKNGRNQIDLDCLVDSGAGSSLFGSQAAELLGIDLSMAERRVYEGIGNITVQGYISTIMLRVKGFAEWIPIEAGFVSENEMPLLGQSGFFENYEVIFRGYQNRFEIKKKVP